MTGKKNGSGHKLTEAQRAEMRRLHAEEGWGYKRLGKRFGVHEQTANRTVNPRAMAQNKAALQRHHDKKAVELAELRALVARLTPTECRAGTTTAGCRG